MTPETSTDTVASLEASRRLFNNALEGISESQARRVPDAGGWTVPGILEHLCITESNVARFLAAGTKRDDAVRDTARKEWLRGALLNRSPRIDAPERIHPTGKFTSLAEARQTFNQTRDATVRLAAENEPVLDSTMVMHPIFGEVSVRQLLVLVAGHSTRHLAQINEILGRSLRVLPSRAFGGGSRSERSLHSRLQERRPSAGSRGSSVAQCIEFRRGDECRSKAGQILECASTAGAGCRSLDTSSRAVERDSRAIAPSCSVASVRRRFAI